MLGALGDFSKMLSVRMVALWEVKITEVCPSPPHHVHPTHPLLTPQSFKLELVYSEPPATLSPSLGFLSWHWFPQGFLLMGFSSSKEWFCVSAHHVSLIWEAASSPGTSPPWRIQEELLVFQFVQLVTCCQDRVTISRLYWKTEGSPAPHDVEEAAWRRAGSFPRMPGGCRDASRKQVLNSRA